MSGEEKFRPCMYQYCDRWCERCAFALRCEQFSPTEFEDFLLDEDIDDEDRAEENEEFWRKLNDILEAAYEMLKDIALQHDVDVEDIIKEVEGGDDEAYDDEDYDDEQREIIDNNAVIKLCNKFESMTVQWFEYSDELLDEKERSINNIINMEIPGMSVEKAILPVNDAFDVINWYNYFIQAKLRRALFYRDSNNTERDANDSNGSAKVALIAIDRSIAAWSYMLDFVPETEDNILQILIVLSEIRKRTEAEFPDARSFKRPGLDK